MPKCGVIYWFKCPHSNCLEEYIGESGRSFGERVKEHLRAQSPIHHHSHRTGHPFYLQCLTIVDRESQRVIRTKIGAMYIHVNDQSLCKNLVNISYPTHGIRYFRTLITTAPLMQHHHPLLNGPSPLYHATHPQGGMHILNW